MKRNVFDQLNGMDDPSEQNLDGLFSSIKKGLKKAVGAVRKVTSKVAKKILPSKVREIGRKIDKSGVLKIAAGAALLVAGGPAIAAGIGKLGGAKALAAKGLSAIKLGAKGAIAVKGVADTAIRYKSGQVQQVQQAAAQQTMLNAQDTYELTQAIGNNKAFADAVAQLRAEGYDDASILQHWRESKSYYAAALPAVAKVVEPQIYSTAVSSGLSPSVAREYAEAESYKVADKAVKETQQGNNNLMPLVGLAALLLFK